MDFKKLYKLLHEDEQVSAVQPLEYQGQHGAPDVYNSPLWNVTKNGEYPNDFYQTMNHYDHGEKGTQQALGIISGYYERPNAKITIYRAVPNDIGKVKINRGDWVTIVRSYAAEHGYSNLRNKFKIIQKTVFARDVFNSGDSVLEWGYDPQPRDFHRDDQRKLDIFTKRKAQVLAGEKISGRNADPKDPFYNNDQGYLQRLDTLIARHQKRLNPT